MFWSQILLFIYYLYTLLLLLYYIYIYILFISRYYDLSQGSFIICSISDSGHAVFNTANRDHVYNIIIADMRLSIVPRDSISRKVIQCVMISHNHESKFTVLEVGREELRCHPTSFLRSPKPSRYPTLKSAPVHKLFHSLAEISQSIPHSLFPHFKHSLTSCNIYEERI